MLTFVKTVCPDVERSYGVFDARPFGMKEREKRKHLDNINIFNKILFHSDRHLNPNPNHLQVFFPPQSRTPQYASSYRLSLKCIELALLEYENRRSSSFPSSLVG